MFEMAYRFVHSPDGALAFNEYLVKTYALDVRTSVDKMSNAFRKLSVGKGKRTLSGSDEDSISSTRSMKKRSIKKHPVKKMDVDEDEDEDYEVEDDEVEDEDDEEITNKKKGKNSTTKKEKKVNKKDNGKKKGKKVNKKNEESDEEPDEEPDDSPSGSDSD